ncbi:MAG TPA: AAA family ATPase, partial [Ruminococcaceae bacterium]|nr:AAA family ATPase [Oscillospiraceae bacterium]
MSHDEFVLSILGNTNLAGYIKSRERNDLEYKESFGQKSWAKYAKTMASFANNKGGYILFGVKDNPRQVVGVNSAFNNFEQEKFTEYLNSYFAQEILWETGIVEIEGKSVGFIYTGEAINKPIIAQKAESSEKIACGDVYYRYRARSEKIKYAEMHRIVEDRAAKERESILKLLEVIRKSETANLGIVNYDKGSFSTPL